MRLYRRVGCLRLNLDRSLLTSRYIDTFPEDNKVRTKLAALRPSSK
jgi:hypothetical protein